MVKKGKLEFLLLFNTLEELDRHRSMRLGLPIQRLSGPIPWGYSEVKGEKLLQPIDKCFQILVEAKKHLETSTYKELSAWITQETGVYLGRTGVVKVMEERMPFDEAALPLSERIKYAT